MKNMLCFRLLLCGALSFPLVSCVTAYPYRTGSHYVWIPAHRTPQGVYVRRHRQYIGPPPRYGSVWVPGYYGHGGVWTDGGWRDNNRKESDRKKYDRRDSDRRDYDRKDSGRRN
ncbi:hypothetical protein [Chlorobium phaeobacteroides]|nr:hypothetical protein [Chlorobium phaeobacteroides]MBV5327284.1 hypothetical protein [Chlorobium sp.]